MVQRVVGLVAYVRPCLCSCDGLLPRRVCCYFCILQGKMAVVVVFVVVVVVLVVVVMVMVRLTVCVGGGRGVLVTLCGW